MGKVLRWMFILLSLVLMGGGLIGMRQLEYTRIENWLQDRDLSDVKLGAPSMGILLKPLMVGIYIDGKFAFNFIPTAQEDRYELIKKIYQEKGIEATVEPNLIMTATPEQIEDGLRRPASFFRDPQKVSDFLILNGEEIGETYVAWDDQSQCLTARVFLKEIYCTYYEGYLCKEGMSWKGREDRPCYYHMLEIARRLEKK